jgi:rhodanese-related sulfurtransferase
MKKLLTWRTAAAVILAAAVLSIVVFAQQGKGMIVPADAQKLVASDSTVVVLDVRTPAEFTGPTGHLKNAILIPVQELESRVGELATYKGRTILVYCRSGHRSTTASSILAGHGFAVQNMDGGINRWIAENLPVVH